MATQYNATIDYKGLKIAVAGAYSRFVKAVVDTYFGTSLFFRDYATAEDAERKMLLRGVFAVFDPENPLHVAQWNAYIGSNPNNETPESADWHPSINEEYWDGVLTKGEMLQEREIKLPTDIAIAFASQALKGELPKTPSNALEMLTAQAYLAAIATGEFPEAKAV